MMIETAKVVSYQEGVAVVQCFAKSSCGGCAAQASCGTKALSALSGEKRAPQFELAVDQPLAVGDFVQIGLSEQTLLQSVFWVYVVPLFVLIGTAVVFSQIFTNELWIALAMLITTSVTFLSIKRMLGKKNKAEFIPIFLGKV